MHDWQTVQAGRLISGALSGGRLRGGETAAARIGPRRDGRAVAEAGDGVRFEPGDDDGGERRGVGLNRIRTFAIRADGSDDVVISDAVSHIIVRVVRRVRAEDG